MEGHGRFVEGEQHLEQLGGLDALDGGPRLELRADRVDERAKVLLDALACAQARPTRQRVWRRDRHGPCRGLLVRVAVFNPLLVILDVLLYVLLTEPLNLPHGRLLRLLVLIGQAVDKIRYDAHLLLV